MKIEISVSVPQLSAVKGAVAYVATCLSQQVLTIEPVKGGGLGLFSSFKPSEKFPDPEKQLLVWYCTRDETDKYRYYNRGYGYYTTHPSQTSATHRSEDPAFFGVVTPASDRLIEKFIDEAYEAFKLQIEADGEEQPPITIEINQ